MTDGTSHRQPIELAAVLSLCAVPVLFPPETAPWHAVALAAAAAAVALALSGPRAAAPGRRGLWMALLALPPVLLSAWFTSDAAGTRDRLVQFAIYLVAFRAGRDLLGRPGRATVLRTLAALGSITAAYGIYQRFAGFDLALESLRAVDSPEAAVIGARLASGRVFSTFLLPSTFAGFLLLSIPATVSWGMRSAPRVRTLAGVATVLQGSALFLTYSHGAWLAATVTAIGALALGVPRRHRTALLVVSGLALVALVAVAVLRSERPGRGDDPVSERLGNWSVAARQIADHPLAGVGWGAYGASYPRYQRPGMNQSRFAHNTWLQMPAEGGLLTLPFLALFLAGCLRLAFRGRPAGRLPVAGLVAVVLHNGIDFTLLLPSVGVPFFLLLGSRSEVPALSRSAPRAGRASAILLAGAITLFGVPAALGRGRAAAAREEVLQGRMEPAGDRIAAARRLDPWSAEYRDFAARWELDSGNGDPASLQRARALAEEAIRLAPAVPHHHATLSAVCRRQGDLGCAYRAASRAAALFPISGSYRRQRDDLRRALEPR